MSSARLAATAYARHFPAGTRTRIDLHGTWARSGRGQRCGRGGGNGITQPTLCNQTRTHPHLIYESVPRVAEGSPGSVTVLPAALYSRVLKRLPKSLVNRVAAPLFRYRDENL